MGMWAEKGLGRLGPALVFSAHILIDSEPALTDILQFRRRIKDPRFASVSTLHDGIESHLSLWAAVYPTTCNSTWELTG
ncbi:hypothetical protein BC832DRAFT_560789 [Gaertneriomyces semiglobifer]|nr:hypothetical protein BC832DRAFT_560789 [Gaertneriomyces semiglobifer]